MINPEQSDMPQRQAGDDVTVTVTFRRSAFERLTRNGLRVDGLMQLVQESEGGYSVCIWCSDIPDWPDPVPGNAAAAAEKGSRRS